MKLTFSTEFIPTRSFLDTCRVAYEYGYDAFEIFDAAAERADHADSILNPAYTADSRRKLVNRRLQVSALAYPRPVCEAGDGEAVCKYVLTAASAGIERVIVNVGDDAKTENIAKLLEKAVKTAEENGVSILFETVGALADTKKAIELFRLFKSGAVGACWNVRDTYFFANESAGDTITNLGAYIGYVRLGDMKNGEACLLGEGELPLETFTAALFSLNYDGYVSCDKHTGIADFDLELTYFAEKCGAAVNKSKRGEVYYNRAGTGTFPWKKYDLLDKNFPQVLDFMAEKYPDQLAFKYTTLDFTRTYAQFNRDVNKVAAALIALGVKPGYHVAVWATNVPEWFLTFWATVKIGAVLVTVNTAYKIQEAEYLLRQSDTHTLVMIESCKDSDYKGIIEELCPELKTLKKGEPLYSERLPFLRNVVTVGFETAGAITFEEMLELSSAVSPEEVRRRAAAVKPDDVANMQYTSGTTGFPKGVMLTHSNIINNGKIIGDRMDLSTADRMMVQVPMFHCFGMVLTMTSIMTHGGTLCPLPYFSPKSSLACITSEKITCFNGVPTMFIAMFAHEDFAKTDFSHVRTGIMAGANCPAELMRKAAREMNMKEIISVYGQTEASPGCTMGEISEDEDHRVETVGTAFPNVECKIINPETGEELPDGESGEFVARGFNIMKGYYKMPEATAAAIDEDGWLHSGDICMRTNDGYYKVTGRLKDMIIRGGENIYPREIEEFYLTNEKVKDIQVVGVPDKRYGEEACAWIILHDGAEASEEEMREFGKAHIASHKVPRYFIFAKSFPMNAAGKILKYKMKETSAEMLGLNG